MVVKLLIQRIELGARNGPNRAGKAQIRIFFTDLELQAFFIKIRSMAFHYHQHRLYEVLPPMLRCPGGRGILQERRYDGFMFRVNRWFSR